MNSVAVTEANSPEIAAPADSVRRLEAFMREMPQTELETRHYFVGGMYGREMIMPAGTCLVGKLHKKDHFFLLTKGKVRVVNEDGAHDIEAPFVLCSKAGTKRAIFAIVDSVGMNVHRTDLTDVDLVEAEQIEPEGPPLFDSRNKLVTKWPG